MSLLFLSLTLVGDCDRLYTVTFIIPVMWGLAGGVNNAGSNYYGLY